MAFNLTNTKASPALRGQAAVVTLSAAQSVSLLPLVTVGATATIGSNGKTGLVSFVDSAGHSFEVTPTSPAGRFDSDTPGYLKVNELVTIS